MRLDLGKGKGNNEVEILEEGDDDRSFVSNLTNITDYSKRDLYNKLKEMQIALANQPGSPKEGTTVEVPPAQKTWTEGSAPQGNSESQQTTQEVRGVGHIMTTPVFPQLPAKRKILGMLRRSADSRYQLPPWPEGGCMGGLSATSADI